MYKYHHPKPIEVKLIGEEGFKLRQKAAEYLAVHENHTGAQRANTDRQGYGLLAEMVIRGGLQMPEFNPEDHPLGHDIQLPSGVKVDIKCRGGEKPFLEIYEGGDGLPRESKHNFFARQLHQENLDADIFVMTHLLRPKPPTLPGTKRQKKWVLYICGWISKKRVLREGVYLPPGAISERGREWFAYQYNQIEFYNYNLNGLSTLTDLLKIDQEDIRIDENKVGDLNLTRVDTLRVGYDLAGRGILKKEHVDFIRKEMNLNGEVGSFLHNNQSLHVIKWLREKEVISDQEYKDMLKKLPIEVEFTGLGR